MAARDEDSADCHEETHGGARLERAQCEVWQEGVRAGILWGLLGLLERARWLRRPI